jgi:hypothetical protein
MAKIVQVLTRPSKQYEQKNADALIRDLDSLIQKLNSTFQQDFREELERKELFMNRYGG